MPQGKVLWFDENKGYGFIGLGADSVFVHHSHVRTYGQRLSRGDTVQFDVIATPKGKEALNVRVTAEAITSSNIRQTTKQPVKQAESQLLPSSKSKPINKHLADALLARQNNDAAEARLQFERAIQEVDTPDAFFPYIAMERQLNNIGRARKLAQRAIARFPYVGKLYEDYGVLEMKFGETKRAVEVFTEGLQRAPKHSVLNRFLGQSLFKLGDAESLTKAQSFFAKAKDLGALDPSSEHEFKLTKLLTGHQRGKAAFEFFTSAGFALRDVYPHAKSSNSIDLFVESSRPEYVESYDLGEQIVVRCLLTSEVQVADVEALLKDIQELSETKPFNRDVIFLVVQNSANIRNYLYALLERPGKNPTIVPIDDAQIRASHTPQDVDQTFKVVLDEWLYRRNLYDESFPVSGRRFFGREHELAGLIRSIDTGTPVGLFGLRKVGKTSLLKKLKEKRPQDVVMYLDLQAIPEGVRETRYLYWEMANQLRTELRRKNLDLAKALKFRLAGRYSSYTSIIKSNLVATEFDADLRLLRQAFVEAGDSSTKVVLLLDELERILPTAHFPGFTGYADFFAYLRGVCQQEGMLISIVTGANPAICDEPQWEGRDNPVFKFYRETFLPPLERFECDEMIKKLGRGMGITYTPRSLDKIYEETGGHPFVTRQLCSRIVKHFRERPLHVDVEKVNVGIQEFLFHDSNTFKEILGRLERDFPEEKELLLFIAEGIASESELVALAKKGIYEALRHLVSYQLVQREGTQYRIKIALFETWIHRYWLGR
jgi:cold shock CspA family protein